MKYKIKYVGDEILHDYAGLNYYAALAFGIKYPYGKNVILIDRKLDALTKRKTIRHECVECSLMSQGKSYWSSHKIALKLEDNVN